MPIHLSKRSSNRQSVVSLSSRTNYLLLFPLQKVNGKHFAISRRVVKYLLATSTGAISREPHGVFAFSFRKHLAWTTPEVPWSVESRKCQGKSCIVVCLEVRRKRFSKFCYALKRIRSKMHCTKIFLAYLRSEDVYFTIELYFILILQNRKSEIRWTYLFDLCDKKFLFLGLSLTNVTNLN